MRPARRSDDTVDEPGVVASDLRGAGHPAVRLRQRNRRGISESFAKKRIAASSLSDPLAARRRWRRPSAESFQSMAANPSTGGAPGFAVTAST